MGREFVNLFDDWAESYDETVSNGDNEYHEVFERYEDILSDVVRHSTGNVLEFGVGTGNLTAKLMAAGHQVFGVEPSPVMRGKAQARLPELSLYDGDFLQFPVLEATVQTIVSSYAFHHLTDDEKRQAVRNYGEWLPKGGKIVFADTVFKDETTKEELFQRVKGQNYYNLLHDLQTEYYPCLNLLKSIFADNGFEASYSQLNRYVWLIEAEKS